MTEDQDRPSLLGGLWTLLVGGAAIAVLLVILHPITSQQDCPNYHAAGNASAFANPDRDFYLVIIMLGWILLTALEQALPTSWRHRSPWDFVARSAGAIMIAVIGSCCIGASFMTVCH